MKIRFDKVFSNLEKTLSSLSLSISKQKQLSAVRDAFLMFTPFIIIGSLFLVFSSIPLNLYQNFMKSFLGNKWQEFLKIPFYATFSLISLYLSFLVSFFLAKKYKIDAIFVALISLISYLIITPLSNSNSLDLNWLDSKGIFLAVILAITYTEIFRFFILKKITIKLPKEVPPMVSSAFSGLIAAFFLLSLSLIIRFSFSLSHYSNIHEFIYSLISLPLRRIATSFLGSIFKVFINTLFWSFGINASFLIGGIFRPFWIENQAENLLAVSKGEIPPHIFVEQFFDMISMGGAGSTLSLIIAILLFSNNKYNRTIAKLSLVPGLFNINEPLLFGIPVILNPILLIPFNLVPIVNFTNQYISMLTNLVSLPLGIHFPWTVPPIISGFITTGNISGSLIQIFNLILGVFIYLPFLKILDKFGSNYSK